jgi:hypothetical protein
MKPFVFVMGPDISFAAPHLFATNINKCDFLNFTPGWHQWPQDLTLKGYGSTN